ncbi:MAG: histidine phosphatase family protein [Synergistaceae bacterium]|jgi:probable phosphoglycerate mutase|nr:histidine phosphatase family protein [Synergistaceae bacterium]
MSGVLRIFMLRHGKPEFPGQGPYIYGHSDYPLSKLGEKQARKIGKALSRVKMDRIISSDLSRAAETARIVAGSQGEHARVEYDPEIREIYMGEWEGLTKDEIKENYVDIFRERGLDLAKVSAPGGETFFQASERGIRALKRIIADSGECSRILMVAHGAVMWGMISALFGIGLGDIFRFGLDHCALHLVEYRENPAQWGQYRLVRYNWSPDLASYNDDLV